MRFLERAIGIDSNRPNALKNLALSNQALGNLNRAAELFISATQANASDSRSLYHLKELLGNQPCYQVHSSSSGLSAKKLNESDKSANYEPDKDECRLTSQHHGRR